MAFVEVSYEQFYKVIGGPENINPSAHPYHSEWINLNTHAVVGRSEPGYKSPYGTPSRYWLEERFAASKATA
jgi:hypothetical protein